MPLLTLIALPFVASLAAALVPAEGGRARGSGLAGFTALLCLVGAAFHFPEVADGGVLVQRIAWVPVLGLDLILRLDGFAWMFCILVYGIGALVVLYARYYLSASDPAPRFFSSFLAFMGAMSGLVLSGNLLQLAFFWELTSVFSFLLIGYWYHRRDAQRGARMALTVTGAGGLCLLAGVLVLGHVVGSYELDTVLASGDLIRGHALYPVLLVLLLLAAFTKSAQFPFQFWLPRAMAAPTPVSAYLHSATMVKAGVFLLARLWPVLAGTGEWFWLVGSTGLITLLLGAYLALFQNDLKGLLAYSTISHLGLITLLLGLNSKLAAVAAVFHILNHATFKASLFMAAGIVDHETGTRDIRRLSGLRRQMPITTALALVASGSMAGVPLLNGFLSKEMFFSETVFIDAVPLVEWGLPILAAVAGMGSVAYSLRFTVDVFFGPSCEDRVPRPPHEPPVWMRLPVELLVLVCLVVGILPSLTVGPLLAAASLPVVGGALPTYSLAVWHGFNLPLLMSVVALVGGTLIFLAIRSLRSRGHLQNPPLVLHFNGAKAYVSAVTLLTLWGRWARKRILSAGLQRQLLLLLLVSMAIAIAGLPGGLGRGSRTLVPLASPFALLWFIGGGAALAAAYQAKYHRLASLMLMGVAGLACCITFVWFSAPDLALTQLTTEVVTTILILLGLRWLPPREKQRGEFNAQTLRRARLRRTRDFLVALAIGCGMAALTWAVATRPMPASIAPFFIEHALSGGGGRNVVNVILVDFRGFDTFGEVVVLALVALTVYALLRRFRPAPEILSLPPQQRVMPPDVRTDLLNPRTVRDPAVGYLMVPAVLVRLLLPLGLVVSLYFFLRGHNAPGGGFVAGLVTATVLLLQYIVSGTVWVEEHLRIYPRNLIASGLLLVLGTAVGSLFVGYPLLTSHTWHLMLPLLGEVHLASALFFDLGVYCAVVGATMLILVALAHQSVRSHRRSGVE